MKFIDNDRLAWLILRYFLVYDYFKEYDDNISTVTDWLKLSSSIDSITVDTTKYDGSLAHCGKAWDYEEAKSELMSYLTTELVRFHFVWGALESLITEFVPVEKVERFGKINALCGFLKKSQLEDFLPNGYVKEYDHLIALMRKTNQYKNDIKFLESSAAINNPIKNYIDISGIAVYSVYRIRNKFAHGLMKFPEPEGYSNDVELDKDLIVVATRLVLMTIIILLINDIKKNDFALDVNEFDFTIDSYELSLLNYSRNCLSNAQEITAIRYLRSLCIDWE